MIALSSTDPDFSTQEGRDGRDATDMHHMFPVLLIGFVPCKGSTCPGRFGRCHTYQRSFREVAVGAGGRVSGSFSQGSDATSSDLTFVFTGSADA